MFTNKWHQGEKRKESIASMKNLVNLVFAFKWGFRADLYSCKKGGGGKAVGSDIQRDFPEEAERTVTTGQGWKGGVGGKKQLEQSLEK